jgi:hypothetical protein
MSGFGISQLPFGDTKHHKITIVFIAIGIRNVQKTNQTIKKWALSSGWLLKNVFMNCCFRL